MQEYNEEVKRQTYFVSDYEINAETLMMTPNHDVDFHTKVLEPRFEYFVKKTPMELLKQACLYNGSTYDGRVMFARTQLGQRNKVPVLISERLAIIASPTHSPANPYCNWIFTAHVSESKTFNMAEKIGTLVIFKDRSCSFLDLPTTQFKSLTNKALMCQGLLRQYV